MVRSNGGVPKWSARLYRDDHIKVLKEIVENSDDMSLKLEKLYFLKEFLNTSYSKDKTFGYSTHHLDDIKAAKEFIKKLIADFDEERLNSLLYV